MTLKKNDEDMVITCLAEEDQILDQNLHLAQTPNVDRVV